MTEMGTVRCAGRGYRIDGGVIRTCKGCEDCNKDPPGRLRTAPAIQAATPSISHVGLLESRIEKLEALLREAVIYVEPGTNDGAELRARINREIPRKKASDANSLLTTNVPRGTISTGE